MFAFANDHVALTVRDLQVSREWLKAWMWICKAGLPALLILSGVIVLFRRRAK